MIDKFICIRKMKMKLAIPLVESKLSQHFGHCQEFAIVDVNVDSKKIVSTELLTPPAHEPGVLPKWLSSLNVNVIIAGGIGQRAQQLFTNNGIDVVVGAPVDTAENIALAYVNKTLVSGTNVCDH